MRHVPGSPVARNGRGDVGDKRPQIDRTEREEKVEPSRQHGRSDQADAVEDQQGTASFTQH
jgi:hypothetical protein